MPKRQTNKLKWMADLCRIKEGKNPDTDRVEITYPVIRTIKYNNIGVTATDKFTTKDANEVVKKIETRIDRNIENNQKDYRLQISGRVYNIERIYVREEDRMMEVSLSYDN